MERTHRIDLKLLRYFLPSQKNCIWTRCCSPEYVATAPQYAY